MAMTTRKFDLIKADVTDKPQRYYTSDTDVRLLLDYIEAAEEYTFNSEHPNEEGYAKYKAARRALGLE